MRQRKWHSIFFALFVVCFAINIPHAEWQNTFAAGMALAASFFAFLNLLEEWDR